MKGKGQLRPNWQLIMMSSGDKRQSKRRVNKMTAVKKQINFRSFSSLDQIHAIHGLSKRITDQILSLRETNKILKACS